RERRHAGRLAAQPEQLLRAHGLERALVLRQLVGLRQRDHERRLALREPRHEVELLFLGVAADGEEEAHASERRTLLEVRLDQRAPALARGLADLGVAEARQVDEEEPRLAVDLEPVDEARAPRRARRAREPVLADERVDQARLADVRAA